MELGVEDAHNRVEFERVLDLDKPSARRHEG